MGAAGLAGDAIRLGAALVGEVGDSNMRSRARSERLETLARRDDCAGVVDGGREEVFIRREGG